MKLNRSSQVRIVVLLCMTSLILSLLLRVALWISFGRPAEVPGHSLAIILSLGVLNDLIALVYVLVPLTIYFLLVPQRVLTKSWHSKAFAFFVFLLFFGMLYLAAVEYFFFEEFDSRFNLVAVDYLIYPHEVFVNLWESYPIIWFLSADLALSLLLLKLAWPTLRGAFAGDHPASARFRVPLMHALVIAPLLLFISSDSLSFFDNRVANEISMNGISSFFRALWSNHLDYNLYYRTIDRKEAYGVLRSHLSRNRPSFVSNEPDNLTRKIPGKDGLGKMNVVVIVEESLGAGFVGAYGDTKGLTPNIDRLAKQGVLFSNAYATGTRTVRGLEAILTSFPPIPSESIVRRDGNENIANWGAVMKKNGYDTSFIYGGYGVFDNMNYFFRANGFATIDRTDISRQTFANIWGVCDEDLFNHSLDYFDRIAVSGKPFFSVILTTSNHKPYTFPAGIPGIPESGGGRDAGVRYADYALGRLFEKAQARAWYNDTLFVIVADHDARVYGRAYIPVERYRIPLLVLAPAKLSPRVSTGIMSQMDIAPTVLGLLGLGYEAPFYGEDALSEPGERPIPVSHNHDVALYMNGKLAILGLMKEARSVAYDESANEQRNLPPEAEALRLATAYFQTAFDQYQRGLYRLP